ncbi:MAG: aminotransferase class V-fold PLP-dependent enzyme, partial [Planctomycetes bacterium]|nr:aminotransferase class V-fold PLP-dependent enzyme [Planctomycetota bacterium]
MRRIDLDANATTLLHPKVREEIEAALREGGGNPSSIHALGRKSRDEVERARADVAHLLGVDAEELYFT